LVWQESGTSERFALVLLGGGGGGVGCSPKYQLQVIGNPSAGTFVIRLRAKDEYGVWIVRDLTFEYDMTAAQILALIETHPNIEPGVTVVTGGPLTGPIGASSNVTITLPSNAMFGNGIVTTVSVSLAKSGLLDPAISLNECCPGNHQQ
jgi:hypothetical protein